MCAPPQCLGARMLCGLCGLWAWPRDPVPQPGGSRSRFSFRDGTPKHTLTPTHAFVRWCDVTESAAGPGTDYDRTVRPHDLPGKKQIVTLQNTRATRKTVFASEIFKKLLHTYIWVGSVACAWGWRVSAALRLPALTLARTRSHAELRFSRTSRASSRAADRVGRGRRGGGWRVVRVDVRELVGASPHAGGD